MKKTQTRKIFPIILMGLLAGFLWAWPASGWGSAESQLKMEEGKELFSDSKYAEALELFQAVIKEEPENGEAYHYAGLCLMGLGRPAEALPMLEQAASLLPGDLGIQEDIAWAHLAMGNNEKALAVAEAVLAKDPNRPRALYYKGLALIGLKKYEEALPVFQKLAGYPEYQQAGYFFSGVCLSYLGRLDEAKKAFEKAVAAGPDTELGKQAKKYADALKGAGMPTEEVKPISGRVRLLYQYDTNILPVHSEDYLPEDVSNKEDGRVVVDLDLRWNIVNTQNSRTTLRYLGYGSWHSKESEVNLMFHQGEFSTLYQFKAGERVMGLGLSADYSAASLDNEPYSTLWSARPEFFVWWTPALRTRLVVEYQGETFEDPGRGMNNRDNTRLRVTLYQHFLFAEGRVNSWIGYRWGQVNAEGDNYNRMDNVILAGVIFALPKNSLLAVVGRYEMRDYPDNAFDREENLTVANVSFQFPIYKQLYFYTSAVYMNVDANFELLEYDRWIYSGGLMAEF